jgi:histidinol dehydrogenase
MLTIRRFNSQQESFEKQFSDFLEANTEHESDVSQTVQDIIAQIRTKGDSALLDFTHKYDRLDLTDAKQLEISHEELEDALKSIDPVQRDALEKAHQRVKEYAQHQRLESWEYKDEHGSLLGQRVTPLDRVGIYVPGGTAAYPSSVLMNAVPAKVAGVPEIVMVVPTPEGKLNLTVLAAAAVAGVDRVFRIGGAQAVAALAYGTETVPAVDKIVGPGNIYVATAKRMVFGKVGIDMIAGPSEVLVICDDSANPEWIAMDLFSQAEHDVLARTTLISASEDMLDKVEAAMNQLLPSLERADIIKQAINTFGCYVKVDNLEQAAQISNQVAPEHLELSIQDPDKLLESIRHAGAVFMGHHTPEVFGDYCAGPNHVLPTSATARFSSPLGVYDFQKRMTILNCSNKGASELSGIASTLAHSEGLTAHACSAEFRGSVK